MRLIGPRDDTPIDHVTFVDVAVKEWLGAKSAYVDAHRRVDSLLHLLHGPGQVTVSGRVTGALWEAKQLRDDADRLIVALDEIVRAGKLRDRAPE